MDLSCCASTWTLVVLIVLLVYYLVTRKYDYWWKQGVVFVKPSPLLGNYFDYVTRKSTMGEMHKRFCELYPEEKVIGLFRFQTPELIVRDLNLIQRVLVSDFQNFQNRVSVFLRESDSDPLSNNMFSAHFSQWRHMRSKITPTFTSGKLKSMFHLILEVGEEFRRYVGDLIESDAEVEVKELMAKFTTDVIGSCAFGIQMNSMSDDEAPFRKIGRRVFNLRPLQFAKFAMRIVLPGLYNYLKFRVFDKDVEDFFRRNVREICEYRRATGTKRHDLIDVMLEQKAKEELDENNDSKYRIDENFMIAQSFTFFGAGFETSSTLMAFTLYELAREQDVQRKLYEEISEALNSNNGILTYEMVVEMPYLEMVISESMRKYPACGFIMRNCTNPYTFPGTSVKLDKGVSVSIPVLAIHHDRDIYPDPDSFIPERFLPEKNQTRHPMAYLPFGDGPRNCIGLRFGKLQSKIGLITVLKNFYVEPCSRTAKKIEFNPTAIVTTSKHGIWLNLKKRA